MMESRNVTGSQLMEWGSRINEMLTLVSGEVPVSGQAKLFAQIEPFIKQTLADFGVSLVQQQQETEQPMDIGEEDEESAELAPVNAVAQELDRSWLTKHKLLDKDIQLFEMRDQTVSYSLDIYAFRPTESNPQFKLSVSQISFAACLYNEKRDRHQVTNIIDRLGKATAVSKSLISENKKNNRDLLRAYKKKNPKKMPGQCRGLIDFDIAFSLLKPSINLAYYKNVEPLKNVLEKIQDYFTAQFRDENKVDEDSKESQLNSSNSNNSNSNSGSNSSSSNQPQKQIQASQLSSDDVMMGDAQAGSSSSQSSRKRLRDEAKDEAKDAAESVKRAKSESSPPASASQERNNSSPVSGSSSLIQQRLLRAPAPQQNSAPSQSDDGYSFSPKQQGVPLNNGHSSGTLWGTFPGLMRDENPTTTPTFDFDFPMP